MRQLLPTLADVDPLDTYLAAPRPAPDGRPWVLLSMVTTLDGATAVEGVSGDLGGAADKEVFHAVRAVGDVIMAGAGTVRAEGYRPVRWRGRAAEARADAGRSADPVRIAIVSGRSNLDPAAAVFGDKDRPPYVFTATSAPPDAVDRLRPVAEVHQVGDDAVDIRDALERLHADGVGVVVCEGGPTLNAALVDADVVDEICLTLAPEIVGGSSHRVVTAAGPARQAFRLVSLLEDGGVLIGRWVRERLDD